MESIPQTFVHIDCPYIKVSVRFKAASDESNYLQEDPEDTIESILQPFLQFGITDELRSQFVDEISDIGRERRLSKG